MPDRTPTAIDPCPGVYAEGWREGCEDCQRRTAPAGDRAPMEPPALIVFECPFYIHPDAAR